MFDFNIVGLDVQVIVLVDSVMVVMGGCEVWDNMCYIVWNFFGCCIYVWDKWIGNFCFELQVGKVILMNINLKEGKVFVDGNEVFDVEVVVKDFDGGYKVWINDLYWLMMFYKFKDSGVMFKYVGKGEFDDGCVGQVVQLIFEGVGVILQNKYYVYVVDDLGFVEQWVFFLMVDVLELQFKMFWVKWMKYGDIMFLGDCGQFQFEDIYVYDEFLVLVFEDLVLVDYVVFLLC